MLGQAEFAAERAHLVLEQFAQRLDQLQVHPRRQAADIVVRLDRDAGAAGGADQLDDVGVERALREEFDAADLLRLGVEHVDKGGADDLALLLGVGDAGELAEKQLAGIAVDRAGCCSGRETGRTTSSASPSAQQPGIDKDAGQPLADRLVDQRRGDREVDAARQAADDAAAGRPGRGCARSPGRGTRAIVQSPRQPQMRWVKFRSSAPPCGVCTTSGWNRRRRNAALSSAIEA